MTEFENRVTNEDLDLTPIEERLVKKTGNGSGWRWEVDPDSHHVTFWAGDFLVMDFPPGTFDGYRPYDEDRDFIANAPTDITALLAEVKRLRKVEETLRDRIDEMVYTCEH